MSGFVYPRLPREAAEALIAQLAESEPEIGFSHPKAVPYVVGTPVPESKLKEVRDAVVASVDALSSSDGSGAESARWDLAVGEALYRTMEIVPSDASHEGPWAFLTLVVMPDLAIQRFPERHPSRMYGGRRNAFRRTWWRHHILADRASRDGVRPLGEDEMVNIFERSKMARNHALARVLAEAILDYTDGNRSDFTRRLTKRVRALTGPLLLDVCNEAQLRSLVKEAVAFESDLTDRGGIVLDDQGGSKGGILYLEESRYDWNSVIEQLNQGPYREIHATMGTPKSAQVTRVRILRDWNGVDARTEGRVVMISLK